MTDTLIADVSNDINQRLILTEQDKNTLYLIAIYVACIFILWNMPYLKHVLYPFKLTVVSRRSRSNISAHAYTCIYIHFIYIFRRQFMSLAMHLWAN